MTSTASVRITGPELLALWEQMKNGPKAEMVRAAGYIGTRDDGGERLYVTDFYEAVIAARNGYGNPGPTSAIFAGWTTPEGEPIGPWFPIVPGFTASWASRISFTEDALAAAKQWAKDHAVAILDPHPLAYLVICDDAGTERLMEAERIAWAGSSHETTSYLIGPCDTLPHNIHSCRQCGALTTEADGTELSNGFICSDCAESLAVCDDCGAIVEADTLQTVADGNEVCPRCLDRDYLFCPRSEEYHPINEMVRIYGLWWEDGTSYSYLHRDSARELLNDGRLWLDIDGCYTSNQPEPYYDDDQDQGPEGVPMYCYGTDPNDELGHDMPNTGHRYGAELEYKGNHPNGYKLRAAMDGEAILTEDSSVTGEVVTACLTMGELRRRVSAITAALANTYNDANTGLHIHTDRRALSPWQWFRLTQYTKEHADILAKVAGRDNHQYGSFHRTSADTWGEFMNVWHYQRGDRKDGWSFRRETVELRVCRATRTRWRALARLSFLQRLLAIGRLPDSAKPTAEELPGFLAQDPRIARLTGWEPGTFNYREAMCKVAQGPDLSPAQSATRADVWMAEIRLNRSLLQDEERRITRARQELQILTT